MRRLLEKTAFVLGQLDDSIPVDLAARSKYHFRTGFLGDGYARTNDETERAIAIARDDLGIALEATYTGKAMAALLSDLKAQAATGPVMFWNTYNSRPLPTDVSRPGDEIGLPEEFQRYFD